MPPGCKILIPLRNTVAKPTDLSQKWWKKHKAVTLKSTGFGKVLGAYEAALAKPNSKTNIQAMIKALKAIEPARSAAEKMCNKTLHKDTIAILAAYKELIVKESTKLQKRGADYEEDIKAWTKKRTDCVAGMKKHEKDMETLVKKADATLQTARSTAANGNDTDKARTVKLCNAMIAELKKARAAAKDTMDTVRIAGTGPEPVHAEDRDPAIFTEAINIQAVLEHEHNTKEGELKRAIKTLE